MRSPDWSTLFAPEREEAELKRNMGLLVAACLTLTALAALWLVILL